MRIFRDPSHVGLGDETSLGVDGGVEDDVFEHTPGSEPDGALDNMTTGEHLCEWFGAPDDSAVGDHTTMLLAKRPAHSGPDDLGAGKPWVGGS